MIYHLLKFVIAIVICGAVHEFGHWIIAKAYGSNIKFTFTFGKLFNVIPIPRFTWQMPNGLDRRSRTIIRLSGFTFEFILAVVCCMVYPEILLVSIIHLFAYNFYAGDATDFNFK